MAAHWDESTFRLPRIVVLSAYNTGNFGDRLGYYNINSIVPENAIISFASFNPWRELDPKEIDVLVVGIGNSIFEQLLTEQVVRLVEAVPYAVGIFGTQYRQSTNNSTLIRLISKLNFWYARNEDDLKWFGSINSNCCHLGDWLINLFPMADPVLKQELNIKDELLRMRFDGDPLKQFPLDRIIQTIQKYERVFSPKLHLLLCALTSARTVSYCEQRDFGSQISGKFSSLLYDVFGRHFDENVYFEVDKEKVIDYKIKVRNNMQMIKTKLAELSAEFAHVHQRI